MKVFSQADAELVAKMRSNDELIARLRAHVDMLEKRLTVMLVELKRERENPLPESVVVKSKTVIDESVLKIAPRNEGQTKAGVSHGE